MLCWRSVHTRLMMCWLSFLGVATSTLTIFPLKTANTSIMGKSHSTALGLYKMPPPKWLALGWCSVDALLMLFWPCADALLMLCWCLVDPLLTLWWCSVDALLTLCRRSVDALWTLCWHSVDTELTLCWHCVDALLTHILRCSDINTNYITNKGGQILIMGKCHGTAFGLYNMQHPESLMLCWRSVDAHF